MHIMYTLALGIKTLHQLLEAYVRAIGLFVLLILEDTGGRGV